jgi:hypothetical protein
MNEPDEIEHRRKTDEYLATNRRGGIKKLMEESGLSKATVIRFAQGKRAKPETLIAMGEAIQKLWRSPRNPRVSRVDLTRPYVAPNHRERTHADEMAEALGLDRFSGTFLQLMGTKYPLEDKVIGINIGSVPTFGDVLSTVEKAYELSKVDDFPDAERERLSRVQDIIKAIWTVYGAIGELDAVWRLASTIDVYHKAFVTNELPRPSKPDPAWDERIASAIEKLESNKPVQIDEEGGDSQETATDPNDLI